LGIYVGTSAEWAAEVVEVIVQELRRLKKEGLSAAELRRVKNQLKGNLLLGLETSDSRMTRIAKNEIYFGQDISPEEIASRIDATTNDEIVALAEALLREEQLALTLLGDLKGNALPDIATASA
jgi:predicted Zn-dependent peptidase